MIIILLFFLILICIFISIPIAKLIVAYLYKLEFDCSLKDGYDLANIDFKESLAILKEEIKNLFNKETK